jgi:hypothetical protein
VIFAVAARSSAYHDDQVTTRGDVAFVNRLGARCGDLSKVEQNAPAPITVGELRRILTIMASQIETSLAIGEELKRTCAALGIVDDR